MQLPRIGPFVVRLFNTLDSSDSSSSVEELELLNGELNKSTTIFDDRCNVKEFVEKYNIDKDFVKRLLEEIRHNLDLLICQNFYDLQTTHPEFAKPLQHSKLIRGEEKTAQENNRR